MDCNLGPGLRRDDNQSVIPGERAARGPGSKGDGDGAANLGPGLRRDNNQSVIPGERAARGPG